MKFKSYIVSLLLLITISGCSGKSIPDEEAWSYNDDYVPHTNLIVGTVIIGSVIFLRSPLPIIISAMIGCSKDEKSYNPCTDPTYKVVPCK